MQGEDLQSIILFDIQGVSCADLVATQLTFKVARLFNVSKEKE